MNKTQKLIMKELLLKEIELSIDKEDFLSKKDWKNYNDNLKVMLKEVI